MKAKSYTKETIRDLALADREMPVFEVGDTIEVGQKIKEGNKYRVQKFQGDVIAKSSNGASSTFTVRKIGANAISVEKIFPVHLPTIESIRVLRKGVVRRAKLFYLRDRIGKRARVQEKRVTDAQKAQKAAAVKANAQAATVAADAEKKA